MSVGWVEEYDLPSWRSIEWSHVDWGVVVLVWSVALVAYASSALGVLYVCVGSYCAALAGADELSCLCYEGEYGGAW